MGGLVGGIGNLLGGGSGNNAGFQAQGVNVVNPVTQGNLNDSLNSSHAAMAQQQALSQALAAQHGIQNQSNVFNQLQGVANGQGPNPAQAMLNQATGQNVANQAALMAGQRGAGANAGLLARQAAEAGGAAQQNAAAQGASLQANQSLGALNQLGGIAGQQVGQQQNAVAMNNQNALNEQNLLNNAFLTAQGQNVQQQGNVNNANAQVAGVNAKNTAGFLSGGLNALGGAAANLFMGGGKAAGAPTQTAGGGDSIGGLGQLAGLATMFAAHGGEVKAPNPKIEAVAPADRFAGVLQPHIEHMARIYHPDKFAQGGKVNAMVSPGELYLPPEKAKEVAEGKASPMKEGMKIPGKAEVKGDSKKNDKVPAKLEEGGVVIPRSVMQSKNPGDAAAKFVESHIKEHGSGDEEHDFKSALKKAILNRKSK